MMKALRLGLPSPTQFGSTLDFLHLSLLNGRNRHEGKEKCS